MDGSLAVREHAGGERDELLRQSRAERLRAREVANSSGPARRDSRRKAFRLLQLRDRKDSGSVFIRESRKSHGFSPEELQLCFQGLFTALEQNIRDIEAMLVVMVDAATHKYPPGNPDRKEPIRVGPFQPDLLDLHVTRLMKGRMENLVGISHGLQLFKSDPKSVYEQLDDVGAASEEAYRDVMTVLCIVLTHSLRVTKCLLVFHLQNEETLESDGRFAVTKQDFKRLDRLAKGCHAKLIELQQVAGTGDWLSVLEGKGFMIPGEHHMSKTILRLEDKHVPRWLIDKAERIGLASLP
ncbi:hypothetical protein F4778DRAFT_775460 [Xylariomycetidae sp. FL2044]|nr:hypothetical protein F4778DRAFT_775460 [Xylariomycetidae sp. FL2044]